MQVGDFVLYDDPGSEGVPEYSHPALHLGGHAKPSFFEHRGQAYDGSPLFEEAQPSTILDAQNLAQKRSYGSPATLPSTSPNVTPPQQPSSGTLGAPLNLLSLQGDSDPATPKLSSLFPESTGNEPLGTSNTSQRSSLPPLSQPNTASMPQQRWTWTPTPDALQFLWKGDPQSTENLQRWKAYWAANGGNAAVPSMAANADVLRATGDAAGLQQTPADKLTVSPRDIELSEPPSQQMSHPLDGVPLFPPRRDDEASAGTMPFVLSNGMETSSSTEEEDDEDEKPYTASNIGTTVPNEALLQQWSRPMYAPPQNIPMESGSVPAWATMGPSFSQVSTSSESDDDLERMERARSASAFQRSVPGAVGGYGYFPASQDCGLSVNSTDSESMVGSHMSASASETDTRRQRSPSILNSAQAIVPVTERQAPQPSDGDEEDDDADEVVRVNTPPAHAAGARARRTREAANKPSVESADVLMRESSSTPSSDVSSPDADGDSDYEQTRIAHPTPRALARRGRAQRGGHRSTSSASSLHHATGTSTSATPANRGHTSSPVQGSAIRCDYVSPVTHQPCGTVFHRMYDLARHRITLHLREEAQLVKDGHLRVDQCVVLGKEVDVEKALAELEWTCRVCGARFSRKDAMLRHERLRHHR